MRAVDLVRQVVLLLVDLCFLRRGVKSGQLTAGETAKLENQQKGIHHQVAADRKANGGILTQGEKAQVNHEQNQASKNIYAKKHNGATQGGPKK